MTNKLPYIITLLIIVFIICLCNEYLCNYSQMNTFRISTTENNSSSPISKFRSAVRKVININKLRGKKFEQLDPPLKEDLEDLDINEELWESLKFPYTLPSKDDSTITGLINQHKLRATSTYNNTRQLEPFTISSDTNNERCATTVKKYQDNNCYEDLINYLKKGTDACIKPDCIQYHQTMRQRLVDGGCEEDILGTGISFNTVPKSCNNNTDGIKMKDSNYIGPGTKDKLLFKYNIIPLSITDQIALVHDIMYSLSSNQSEGINSDQVMIVNMLHNKQNNGESSKNLKTATRIAKLGKTLNMTFAFGIIDGITRRGAKDIYSSHSKEELKLYEDILNALLYQSRKPDKMIIVELGYLKKFFNIRTGKFEILNSKKLNSNDEHG